MTRNEPKTTAFDLRNRDYDATCDGVQVQFSAPKNQVPYQDTNLTMTLIGISPEDLATSKLSKYAFPRRTVQQGNIEEVAEDKDPVTVQAIDGVFTPGGEDASGYDIWITPLMPLPGEITDDREGLALEEAAEPSEVDMTPFKLRPSSIELKAISRSETSLETDPLVDYKLMLKGLGPAEAGRVIPNPWRLMSFKLRIVPSLIGD